MSNIKYIILSFLLCLLSCTTEDYDTGYRSKMVVYAHFSSSNPAKLFISNSSEVLKQGVKVYPLNDAEVDLHKGDFDYFGMTNMGFGKYESDYIPEVGKSYTLYASCLGYEDVEMKVDMPKEPEGFDFSYESSYTYIDTMFNYIQDTIVIPVVVKDTILLTEVSIKFKDFSETGNYYRLSIRQENEIEIDGKREPFYKLIAHNGVSFEPELNWTWFYGLPREYIFFNDEINNGSNFEIKVKLTENSQAEYPVKYYIYFEHLSDQTVEYYTDLANYYSSYSKLVQSLDSTMNVDIMKTDDVPNYVPYVSKSYVKGGYGAITAGSGFTDSIVYETKPEVQ